MRHQPCTGPLICEVCAWSGVHEGIVNTRLGDTHGILCPTFRRKRDAEMSCPCECTDVLHTQVYQRHACSAVRTPSSADGLLSMSSVRSLRAEFCFWQERAATFTERVKEAIGLKAHEAVPEVAHSCHSSITFEVEYGVLSICPEMCAEESLLQRIQCNDHAGYFCAVLCVAYLLLAGSMQCAWACFQLLRANPHGTKGLEFS